MTPPQLPALYDLVADAIDAEAEAFADRPRFRAACARVLEAAQQHDLHEVQRDVSVTVFTTALQSLKTFRRPEMTIDALHCIGRAQGGRRQQGDRAPSISALARRHGVSKQAFHRRILRVARLLGIKYRRTKPHRPKRAPEPAGKLVVRRIRRRAHRANSKLCTTT